MVKHVREVERDLIALQKKRHMEELNLHRVSEKEPVSLISMGI
jgi:hypothetical protein